MIKDEKEIIEVLKNRVLQKSEIDVYFCILNIQYHTLVENMQKFFNVA